MTESRKEREKATRHALFLDISKSIVIEDGFHLLSMERIAEVSEYSKGTVYQHFTCKEEILIQLCIESMTELKTLFDRAINIQGSSRDRLVALFYVKQYWARNDGNQPGIQQHLSMHGVKEKVTALSLQQHEALEASLFNLVKDVVDQAIEDGDLPKHKYLQSAETVYGLWSLAVGGQRLTTSDCPLSDLGIQEPDMTLLRTQALILDGLQWAPLHNEAHFKKLLKRFEAELTS